MFLLRKKPLNYISTTAASTPPNGRQFHFLRRFFANVPSHSTPVRGIFLFAFMSLLMMYTGAAGSQSV
jgi:hypothetical protein